MKHKEEKSSLIFSKTNWHRRIQKVNRL